jgi:hypothetical protein
VLIGKIRPLLIHLSWKRDAASSRFGSLQADVAMVFGNNLFITNRFYIDSVKLWQFR